jgi:putative CocE/NonD family hydrolase
MISVDLWVSSSAVDTDFTAKLIDQYPPSADYPDGYAMLLTDSVVRARLRSFTRAGDDFRRIYAIRNEPLTPGQVYQVVIDLRGTSNLFRAGHKIRLDVSSSNFPLHDANPNTGEAFANRNSAPVTARNTIYVGAKYPSDVVLPIRHGNRNSE